MNLLKYDVFPWMTRCKKCVANIWIISRWITSNFITETTSTELASNFACFIKWKASHRNESSMPVELSLVDVHYNCQFVLTYTYNLYEAPQSLSLHQNKTKNQSPQDHKVEYSLFTIKCLSDCNKSKLLLWYWWLK